MILKLILNILGTIISIIINIVNEFFPSNGLHNDLSGIITNLLTITQQGLNFLYFIFGETVALILPTIIILITTKYIAVPIIQIVRSFFINSNE